MKKTVLLLLTAATGVFPFTTQAAVKPNPLFSKGAVLQRDIPVPVWGTANEGEKVTVNFAGQSVSTTAKQGKWMLRLAPLKASDSPATMTISGENTISIENVLVGEVWVCSGQSNMQWPLIRSDKGEEAVAAANDPQLRLLTVPRTAKDEPQTQANVSWSECTSDSAKEFSAVAYYFGGHLRATLKVPVGLISSNVGGTPAEAWTARKTLESNPALKEILDQHAAKMASFDQAKADAENKAMKEKFQAELAKAEAEGKAKPANPRYVQNPKTDSKRPCGLYNAMIAPLQPYAMRGVIWYQGESNASQAKLYETLFPAMIGNWRAAWDQGEFPFLFVQIAPLKRMRPEIREAQLVSWKKTPNTAMVVTTDVGNPDDVHPTQKEPVGKRLGLAARALAYGEKIEYSGPVYDSQKIEAGKVIVSFKHLGKGLASSEGSLKGFSIAGADKQFVPAEAKILGNTVVVSSPSVTAPVAVRYGFENYPEVNLINQEGLPASPFRTDSF